MIATEERIDCRLDPAVKAWVVSEAGRRGLTLSEVVNERLALAAGLDPARHPVPRKRLGARPGTRKKADVPT